MAAGGARIIIMGIIFDLAARFYSDYGRWGCEGGSWHFSGGKCHYVFPDRDGASCAGYFFHRRIITIADPDAGDNIRGVTYRPRIAIILGGTCLGGSGEGEL